jgi:hypothetical protein
MGPNLFDRAGDYGLGAEERIPICRQLARGQNVFAE